MLRRSLAVSRKERWMSSGEEIVEAAGGLLGCAGAIVMQALFLAGMVALGLFVLRLMGCES